MRTLLVVPHMDDEVISCGGLVQARVAAGGTVGVLCLFGRVYDYGRDTDDDAEEQDFLTVKKMLGYQHHWLGQLQEGEPGTVGYYKCLELIEGALASFVPDEVVTSSPGDLNQDHRHLAHVVGIALRPINLGRVRRVLEFIALDGSVQVPNYYVPVSESMLAAKQAAIAAYRREARTGTSPRSPENVAAQMRVWGSQCGHPLAEAYRVRHMREELK